MKVLVCGMTSQQSNPASHNRVANFTGLLTDALRRFGHQVDWQDPDVSWTTDNLDRWDHVIVGLAPMTSLGANRTYGALSVVNRLWETEGLTLLVDAPDPGKITGSLRTLQEHPEKLVKDFFSYRKGYAAARETATLERLTETVSWLARDEWPTTIVPALPWHASNFTDAQLPSGAAGQVTIVNIDHQVLSERRASTGVDRVQRWAYEHASEGRWLGQQNVTWHVEPVPRSSRNEADEAALKLLAESTGCLIAPTRTGTWWNTRYAQAISQGCPVFTDWQESKLLGDAWNQLPSAFETVDPQWRRELAELQEETYVAAIGREDETLQRLDNVLRRKA